MRTGTRSRSSRSPATADRVVPRPGAREPPAGRSPCGRGRRRSGDPTLFRRVLCRLSYPAVFSRSIRLRRPGRPATPPLHLPYSRVDSASASRPSGHASASSPVLSGSIPLRRPGRPATPPLHLPWYWGRSPAVLTGFEPAASALTGRRALQTAPQDQMRTLAVRRRDRAPRGVRIPVTALKGRRPGPLDDGGSTAPEAAHPTSPLEIASGTRIGARGPCAVLRLFPILRKSVKELGRGRRRCGG